MNYFLLMSQFILDDPEGMNTQMVTGDGMVNYLWRVQSQDKKHSIVLKYGEEQMKVRIYHTLIIYTWSLHAIP